MLVGESMDKLLNDFYCEKDEKKRLELISLLLEDYKNCLDLVLANILRKVELRSNAYLLNLMSKKKKVQDHLVSRFKVEHFNILAHDEDAKTRKNLYIFMGNYIDKNYLLELIKCLKSESINYCISSLILALGNYGIKNIDEILDKYSEILTKRLINQEIEQVHYDEIISSINKVVNKNVKFEKHVFKGLVGEQTIYLTCMEPLINASFQDIRKHYTSAKKYKSGVIVKTNNYDNLFKIRTFYEALLMHNDCTGIDFKLVKENIRNQTRGFTNEKELEENLKLEISKEIASFNNQKKK